MMNGRPGLITIDSGAQSDLISKKMFERLKRDNLERSKCDLVLLDVQEQQIKTYGRKKMRRVLADDISLRLYEYLRTYGAAESDV